MVLPAVVELGLGPVVSKAINSDFFRRYRYSWVRTGGDRKSYVGRVLRGAGPEDGDAGDEEEEASLGDGCWH